MLSRDIASKAVKNILFGGIRLVIGIGAGICTSAMIARRLGPANMGLYSYAMWIVGTLGVLANVGLPAAITKYISEYIGGGDASLAVGVGKRLLKWQLILAAGVAILTACFMLLNTPYRSIIGLAAIMLFAQALQQSLGAALAGIQRFDRIALISFYVALASVASVGVAVALNADVMGMLWATLGGLGVSIWLYYRAVNTLFLKSSPPTPQPPTPPDIFRRIRRFSLTISYVLLVDTIVWQRSEVLFLKWYSTLAEIGFYTLAYSITSRLSDVAGAFSATLLPLYSEGYGRSGLRELGPFFVNGLKYLQMLMVPLCLLGIVIAEPLVRLIYGAQFLPVTLPLQVLFVSLSVTSIGVVISPLLLGTEKQSVIAKYGTLVAVLNIGLDIVLIPKYAALGAAIANCTAQIAGVLVGAFYAVRYMRVSFPWRTTAAIYLASATAVAPAAYFSTRPHAAATSIVVSIGVGVVIYLALLVILGELGWYDWSVLRQTLLTKVCPVEAGSSVHPTLATHPPHEDAVFVIDEIL